MERLLAAKYRVTREIARGGMGAIFDAVHTKTGRRVAVKLLQESEWNDDSRKRFEREARAAGAIDSLHVAQVLDSGEDDDGTPYIVMEYLDGADLKSVLREHGALPEPIALAIAAEALLGLIKAHAVDVIHRDLKPANVFLARADEDRCVVKVLDFGIAKIAQTAIEEIPVEDLADAFDGSLTKTRGVMGSPPYMSPEQLARPREVDARSDLWSIGVVLYEMLTGETPTSNLVTLSARIAAILDSKPRPITSVQPLVTEKVARLVHRALEPDPRQRFPSAREMLDAVRALLPPGTVIPRALLHPAGTDDGALDTTVRRPIVAPGDVQTVTEPLPRIPELTAPPASQTSTELMLPRVVPLPPKPAPAVVAPRPPPILALALVLVLGALLLAGAIALVILLRRS